MAVRWQSHEPKHKPIKRYRVDPATLPQRPERDRTPLEVSHIPNNHPKQYGKYTRAQFFAFYNRYLKTAYWKDLRAEVLDDRLCESCNQRKATQLHHRYYSKFNETILFREREFLDALMPLCYSCHAKRHPHMATGRKVIQKDTARTLRGGS